ncbi:UNVERIFIED_CONTAM: protein ECERIFERUM 2 [Sesamum calycinum]|uniref:Protein ECERIFERUM 2 n=1 Tax=Sesamum calycinum TaxID=2727403 RepID=A0AAW2QMT2_9LAMI
MCVGMSWAHILGDAFSATECINMWGKFMANQTPPPHILNTPPIIHHLETASSCRSLKLLDPLGDNWLTPNHLKMQMNTFHLTEKKLSDLLSGENKSHKVIGIVEAEMSGTDPLELAELIGGRSWMKRA